MFLITAQFRPSRSKYNAEKDGVVFYRITGEVSEKGKRPQRNINSDIHAADASVFNTERAAILSQLRLLFCVIERRKDSGQPFTIDDVTDDFRKALASDESMSAAIARSRTEFPLRNEIVSVGHEFKGDFDYVLTEQRNTVPEIYTITYSIWRSFLKTKSVSARQGTSSVFLPTSNCLPKGKNFVFMRSTKSTCAAMPIGLNRRASQTPHNPSI